MLKYKNCLICFKTYKIWNRRIKTSKYCSRICNGIALKKRFKGKNHPQWKGGKHISKIDGYTSIYCPNHPNANQNRITEHRLVMEKHIGRYLKPEEVVHHINGIRSDNRIENLVLMTKSTHMKFHHPKGKSINPICKNNKWSKNFDYCQQCKRHDRPHNAKGLCYYCYNFNLLIRNATDN